MNEFELIARLTKSLPTNRKRRDRRGRRLRRAGFGRAGQIDPVQNRRGGGRHPFHAGNAAGKNRAQGAGALLERHRGDGRHACRRAASTLRPCRKSSSRNSWQNLRRPERARRKARRGDCRRRDDDESRTAFSFPSRCSEPCRAENKFCAPARKSATPFL